MQAAPVGWDAYGVDVGAYGTVVFAASPLNERYVGKDPNLQHHNTFWEATCLDTDLLEPGVSAEHDRLSRFNIAIIYATHWNF
jgi:hypothetical protein